MPDSILDTDSILDSTKKMLGIDMDYDVFDPDITMHINAVLSKLNQLGIGPVDGFFIEDASATWTQFLGTDPRYNGAKTFVYMSVKMLFDPPDGRFSLQAMKEEIAELQWRLSTLRESATTLLLSSHKRITGNYGDEHRIRMANPAGTTLINAQGVYEATFVPREDTSRVRKAKLDVSQAATGVLFLTAVIKNGVYTVRSLNPRRTIMVVEVSAQ